MGRKKKPIKLVTLDTETYKGLIGDLKRIAIYDGNELIYGYKYEDVEKNILSWSNDFKVHVYIHNMEFDLRKISQVFNEVIWDKSFVINGRIAKLTKEKYVFHDSFKLLPMSLAKLSKDFNVEHGKLDLWDEVQRVYPNKYKNVVDFLDRCHVDDELYLRYLGYDVKSLYEVIQKIIELSGLSLNDFVTRLSTASISRFLFKNGYKGHIFSHDKVRADYEYLTMYSYDYEQEIEEFLRGAYCGGRTEVFKPVLNKSAYHYDVKSLYPYNMWKHEYPIGKPNYTNKSVLVKSYFEKWLDNKEGLGILSCDIYIPKQHIPPLPCKMGKLAFVCGHVYGTWSFVELEYAIQECGCVIKEYHECVFYKRTYPIFRNFVEIFSKEKERADSEGNLALRTWAKLIQNVGYGYTGMRRDDKTSLLSIEELHSQKQVKNINPHLGYIEVPTEIHAEYIQVQVALYVTSYSRLQLLKTLKLNEKNGGNNYYCDTDSIVTDKKLPDSITGEVLGKWSLESQPFKGIFLKPKVYTELFFDTKTMTSTNIKFKGVSRETQKDFIFEDYEHLLEELEELKNDFVIVEKNRLMMHSIMTLQKDNLDLNTHEYRDKKMNLKTVEKRIINYKENYTEPYFFETSEDFTNFTFKRVKEKIDY